MPLARRMTCFITEIDSFLSDFNNLKKQVKILHGKNLKERDDIDAELSKGIQIKEGGIVTGVTSATYATFGIATAVVTGGLFGPAIIGAGLVGSIAGAAITGFGSNHMSKADAKESKLITKSQNENTETYKKIGIINEKIQNQKSALQPILVLIDGKFEDFVIELERINGNPAVITSVNHLIVALKSASIVINNLFASIESQSSQTDEKEVMKKLAENFGEITNRQLSVKALFQLIRSKIGEVIQLKELLDKIEKAFDHWITNMRTIRLVSSCRHNIQKFQTLNCANPTEQLIHDIITDLEKIKKEYEEILKHLETFDHLSSINDEHQRVIAQKEIQKREEIEKAGEQHRQEMAQRDMEKASMIAEMEKLRRQLEETSKTPYRTFFR